MRRYADEGERQNQNCNQASFSLTPVTGLNQTKGYESSQVRIVLHGGEGAPGNYGLLVCPGRLGRKSNAIFRNLEALVFGENDEREVIVRR